MTLRLFTVVLSFPTVPVARAAARALHPHLVSGKNLVFEKAFDTDSLLDFDRFVSSIRTASLDAGFATGLVTETKISPFYDHSLNE